MRLTPTLLPSLRLLVEALFGLLQERTLGVFRILEAPFVLFLKQTLPFLHLVLVDASLGPLPEEKKKKALRVLDFLATPPVLVSPQKNPRFLGFLRSYEEVGPSCCLPKRVSRGLQALEASRGRLLMTMMTLHAPQLQQVLW